MTYMTCDFLTWTLIERRQCSHSSWISNYNTTSLVYHQCSSSHFMITHSSLSYVGSLYLFKNTGLSFVSEPYSTVPRKGRREMEKSWHFLIVSLQPIISFRVSVFIFPPGPRPLAIYFCQNSYRILHNRPFHIGLASIALMGKPQSWSAWFAISENRMYSGILLGGSL